MFGSPDAFSSLALFWGVLYQNFIDACTNVLSKFGNSWRYSINAFVSTITVWYIWITSTAALNLVCMCNCRSLRLEKERRAATSSVFAWKTLANPSLLLTFGRLARKGWPSLSPHASFAYLLYCTCGTLFSWKNRKWCGSLILMNFALLLDCKCGVMKPFQFQMFSINCAYRTGSSVSPRIWFCKSLRSSDKELMSSLSKHTIWNWIVDLCRSAYDWLEGNPPRLLQSTPSPPMLYKAQTKIYFNSPVYNYLLIYTKLGVEYPLYCIRHSKPPWWMSQLGCYRVYDVHQSIHRSKGPNHVPVFYRGKFSRTGLQCSSRFDAFLEL